MTSNKPALLELADEAQRRADANAQSAELWRMPLDPFFDRVAAALRALAEQENQHG